MITYHGRKLNRKGRIWLSAFLLSLVTFILLIIGIHGLLHPQLVAKKFSTHSTSQHQAVVQKQSKTKFSEYMDGKVQKLAQTNSGLTNENFDLNVYDVSSSKTYHWSQGSTDQMYTASTVKVPILVELLNQKDDLSAKEKNLVAGMIRNSNNTDATALFREIGGVSGLNGLFERLGMNNSQARKDWWLSTISSKDYIKLLKNIFMKSDEISQADRNYIISEMFQVNPKQQWGISGFSDSANFLANKNGWTLSGSWIMDSIGAVEVDGHLYLISMLSNQHPDDSGDKGLNAGKKEMNKIAGYAGDYITKSN